MIDNDILDRIELSVLRFGRVKQVFSGYPHGFITHIDAEGLSESDRMRVIMGTTDCDIKVRL